MGVLWGGAFSYERGTPVVPGAGNTGIIQQNNLNLHLCLIHLDLLEDTTACLEPGFVCASTKTPRERESERERVIQAAADDQPSTHKQGGSPRGVLPGRPRAARCPRRRCRRQCPCTGPAMPAGQGSVGVYQPHWTTNMLLEGSVPERAAIQRAPVQSSRREQGGLVAN